MCTRRASSGRNSVIWIQGLTRLLLRRSTDVRTETALGHWGACADMTGWQKAFLLRWRWAEFVGIRAGPNTADATRCGGGWRLVSMNELAKTAERKGSFTAFIDATENRRDVCIHLPVNERLPAAGGICRRKCFLSEMGNGSSKHAPLHPIA